MNKIDIFLEQYKKPYFTHRDIQDFFNSKENYYQECLDHIRKKKQFKPQLVGFCACCKTEEILDQNFLAIPNFESIEKVCLFCDFKNHYTFDNSYIIFIKNNFKKQKSFNFFKFFKPYFKWKSLWLSKY